jgi:hypothetical protein
MREDTMKANVGMSASMAREVQPLSEKCKVIFETCARLKEVLCLQDTPSGVSPNDENPILDVLQKTGENLDYAVRVMGEAIKFIVTMRERL